MSDQWRVRGIRGATTVLANEREAIVEGTYELVREMLDANDVVIEDIASVFLTTTQDLNAEFPAVGGRKAGLHHVPLICGTEIPVPGAQERCVRVLMHVNTTKSQDAIRHIYLHEAVSLRPDLERS